MKKKYKSSLDFKKTKKKESDQIERHFIRLKA